MSGLIPGSKHPGITDSRQFIENYDWKAGKPIDPFNREPDRFAVLSGNNNYRSGKISSFAQMKMLKEKYGIKRIINLAQDSMYHQSDSNFNCGGRSTFCEPLWAEELGIEYIPIYLHAQPPSAQNWEIIKESLAQGNTLIHCTWGVDRTGTIAAGWRKTIEPDLTNEEVLDYTYSFGGQWRMPEDPNRHLRAWLLQQEYDRQIALKTRFIMNRPVILIGLACIMIPLGIAIYKKR